MCHACTCHSMSEVRGWLERVNPLLPPCGSNSGCQAWWWVPLSAEPPQWPQSCFLRLSLSMTPTVLSIWPRQAWQWAPRTFKPCSTASSHLPFYVCPEDWTQVLASTLPTELFLNPLFVVFFLFLFWDRINYFRLALNLLCSQGQPWTSDSLASMSLV